MKFVIDNALSPLIAQLLGDAGHHAVHVRAVRLGDAEDQDILTFAIAEERIIVSADTDFSTMLAMNNLTKPSVILFRRESDRRPALQAALLLSNLTAIDESLALGCVVVFDERRIRIRMLPIGGI